MNLETKITIYKFTPQLFTLTQDLSISGAMEKILSISINLSRWIVKGFLPVCSISASLWS